MKILHVVASLQAASGGPAVSVSRIATEQARRGHEVTVVACDERHLGNALPTEGVRRLLVPSGFLSVHGRGWSRKFRKVVMKEAARADIVHNHGLWMWPNAYAREAAVAAGKPLVISPRGMLQAWSLNRSKLRKAVAWRLFEKKNLQSAAMFHATAESEAESIWEATKRLRDKETKRLLEQDTKRQRWETESRRAAETARDVTESNVGKWEGEVPIVVAPNGVDLPDLSRRPGREVLEGKFPELKDRRWVVFMSRLHPKKGVDVLLRAWARQKYVTCDEWRVASWEGKSAQQNVEQGAGLPARSAYRSERGREQGAGGKGKQTAHGMRQTATETKRLRDQETKDSLLLVLAGSDLIGYRKDIERMIKELGVGDSVVITGEVLGQEKDCLLANADVFVLPSYSENFGIVVAEAMAWGRPVITSKGTPWKEVADMGAGWWVDPAEDELTLALEEALDLDAKQAAKKGKAGRILVESNYSWEQAAEKLLAGYIDIAKS